MNDNKENVISLKSREPISVVREKERQAEIQREIAISADQQEAKKATLEALDRVREMVASDRIGGLVLISQELESGLFMQEVILSRYVIPPQNLFGWAGAMQTLTFEIADLATMAPTLLSDGTICDPYAESEVIFGEEEDQ